MFIFIVSKISYLIVFLVRDLSSMFLFLSLIYNILVVVNLTLFSLYLPPPPLPPPPPPPADLFPFIHSLSLAHPRSSPPFSLFPPPPPPPLFFLSDSLFHFFFFFFNFGLRASTKTECDYLNGWILKKRTKTKTVTYVKISPQNGEIQRCSWATQKKKVRVCVCVRAWPRARVLSVSFSIFFWVFLHVYGLRPLVPLWMRVESKKTKTKQNHQTTTTTSLLIQHSHIV